MRTRIALGFAAVLGLVGFGCCLGTPNLYAQTGARSAIASTGAVAPSVLSGRVIAEGSWLGQPTDMLSMAGRLIVASSIAKPKLAVIDPGTGKLLSTFGQTGHGADTLANPWSLDRTPGDSTTVSLWDAGTDRLSLLDVGSSGVGQSPALLRAIDLSMFFGSDKVLWASPHSVLMTGFFYHRFKCVNPDLALGGDAGPLVPGPDSADSVQRGQAYYGKWAARPDHKFVVFASMRLGQITIYRNDGTLAAEAEVPEAGVPHFVVVDTSGHSRFDYRPAPGYLSVTTTETSFFVLRLHFTDTTHWWSVDAARTVEQYDWNGHLLRTFELDGPANSIAVDEAGQTLYAARRKPTPTLLAYQLPESSVVPTSDEPVASMADGCAATQPLQSIIRFVRPDYDTVARATDTAYTPAKWSDSGKSVLPRTDLIAVVISGPGCGSCLLHDYMAAIRRMKPLLAKNAEAQHMSFGAVGLSPDGTVDQGKAYFNQLGAFDELIVGRPWHNTGVLDFVLRTPDGQEAMPQLVLVERRFYGSYDHLRVSPDTVVMRLVGSDAVVHWVAAGAQIPTAKPVL